MKLIDITGKAISGEWGNDCEDGNGIPVLRTTNFTDAGVINFANVVLRDIPPKDLSKKFLRPGDIIIEKSGGSDTKPVGRVVYFDSEENKYLINNFTGLLRVVDQTKWYPRYVFYALFANYSFGGTRQYENKTTGLHNLKLDQYLNSFDIPDVDFQLQHHIADTLDKVSEGIEVCRRMLGELDLMVKAKFVEMFGDFKYNTKSWKVLQFDNFAVIDANMTTDYEKYAAYPHIGIDSIEKETGELRGYRTVKEDGVISGKYIFTQEHIIYSKIRPNLNKVALPTFDGLCSADAYPILPKKGVCSRVFLAHVMRSPFFLDYILQFSARSNMPKVNRKEIAGFKSPIPPIELQNEFESFVSKTDKTKLTIQKILDKMEMEKLALMQKYFA